jgi:hypothetical protein
MLQRCRNCKDLPRLVCYTLQGAVVCPLSVVQSLWRTDFWHWKAVLSRSLSTLDTDKLHESIKPSLYWNKAGHTPYIGLPSNWLWGEGETPLLSHFLRDTVFSCCVCNARERTKGELTRCMVWMEFGTLAFCFLDCQGDDRQTKYPHCLI